MAAAVMGGVLVAILIGWVLMWVCCLKGLERQAIQNLEQKQIYYNELMRQQSASPPIVVTPAGSKPRRKTNWGSGLALQPVETGQQQNVSQSAAGHPTARPQLSPGAESAHADYLENVQMINTGIESPRQKMEVPNNAITPADHLANASFGSPGMPGDETRWYQDDDGTEATAEFDAVITPRNSQPPSTAVSTPGSTLKFGDKNDEMNAILHGADLSAAVAEHTLKRFLVAHEDAEAQGCWLLRLGETRGQTATYIVSALFNGKMLHHTAHVTGSNVVFNGTQVPVSTLSGLIGLLNARSDLYPHGLGVNVPPGWEAELEKKSTSSARNAGPITSAAPVIASTGSASQDADGVSVPNDTKAMFSSKSSLKAKSAWSESTHSSNTTAHEERKPIVMPSVKVRPMKNDRLRKHEQETTAQTFSVVKFKIPPRH